MMERLTGVMSFVKFDREFFITFQDSCYALKMFIAIGDTVD